MSAKTEDKQRSTEDVRSNYWTDFLNNASDFLKSNWKLILSFTAVILLVSATCLTTNGVTFSVNIWVFPGFAVLMASVAWIPGLRHPEFWQNQRGTFFTVVPSAPVPPPPPPPCAPPPPPPNTVNGHKRNRLDCRKLSWEQLSPDIADRDTIWKKVKRNLPLEGIFDTEDIKREFSAAPFPGTLRKKAKQEHTMDKKKIFNISIVLTHYKLKAEGVTQCLISGSSHLTSDVLRQLLAFAPDDQEAIALRKRERENEASLEPAERFYLQIAVSVPSYKERLRTVLLKAQLEEKIAQIKPHLETVITACQELMSSEKLITFVELLLTMGNIMNGSEICAFKITFLTKLMDYKSSINKTTSVLDYLTRVIINKCPHIAALEDDLKHVERASRVPFKSLDKEICELSTEIEVLEEDVEKINNDFIKDEEDSFCASIELFAVTAKEELRDVLSLRKNAKRQFALLVQYFGEDSFKPEDFFGIFATLLRQFEDVLKTYK